MQKNVQATYRIQFNQKFTFNDAKALTNYLAELGISHFYASPLLKSKRGSTHGYDIIDHSQLNPELGSELEFLDFVKKLQNEKMGLILDIVPNHIYIGDCENIWWRDVLENGPYSLFANYFDIDWNPPKKVFANKIFLPVLNEPFSFVLENKTVKIVYEKGSFLVCLPNIKLPTNIKSWLIVLEPLLEEGGKVFADQYECLQELSSILQTLFHLPKISENINDKIELFKQENAIKERLEILLNRNPFLNEMLSKQLNLINGVKGNASSFDQLETFLNLQFYRLCYWKVANDEINYRRFFDIFEYASIREENYEVFSKVHGLILEYIKKGLIQGLRIDHIDGLWDPQKYLDDLKKSAGDLLSYLIVEKILTGNEQVQHLWPVQGTVGYDFLNQLNGVFVNQINKSAFFDIYGHFTGNLQASGDVKYLCKKLILGTFLSSELHWLTRRLNRIAENHRSSQDFTSESLKNALIEIIACFPVYRSYIRSIPHEIHEEDRKYILAAVSRARRTNTSVDQSVYQFIQSILLLEVSDDSPYFREECSNFVMHFQQVTSPVMAKGVEDTAFYRYFPLSSLCEVGGDPGVFGLSIENFHKKNLERWEFFPNTMLATTTHDTKRSEDVRARLNVLSEIPGLWKDAIAEWNHINQIFKNENDDEMIPDKNDEYLLYQTLVGAWPLEGLNQTTKEKFRERISTYMEKVIKEAKVHCSWVNPNEEYENGVMEFIHKILDDQTFFEKIQKFSYLIQDFGMLNSLSQVILKLTSPGIPDIYQGQEIWDFSLVDPDNRREVDFQKRRELLKKLENSPLAYLKNPRGGQIKLFITHRLLLLRQRYEDLFSKGSYVPLTIIGPMENCVIAYARIFNDQVVFTVTSRFFTSFMNDFFSYKDKGTWEDSFLEIPVELCNFQFKNIFFEGILTFSSSLIPLQNIFTHMPFAVLEKVN